MFVFGGAYQNHQISKVENYRLTPIGQLSFLFDNGACTNVGNELFFLCCHDYLDSSTNQRCLKATEPLATFHAAEDSSYPHSHTRIGNNGGMVNFNSW